MNYKDVTFDSVGIVRLHAPPTDQIRQILNRLYPEPKAPIRTDTTATGKELSMEIIDDPDYLAEKERIGALRVEKTNELTILAVFRDLVVPDDWQMDPALVEVMQYADPDYQWMPREGKQGRKLDYVEWCVLESMGDTSRYTNALYELMGLDLDLADQIGESFRNNVEEPPA